MNKAGNENRSVRNTKRRLRESLLNLMNLKPINEITAKELTELADVNRGTFYFHYDDIYHLLHSIEDEFFEQFNAVLNDLHSPSDDKLSYLTAIFSFIGQNNELCGVMLGTHGDIQFVNRVKQLVDEKCASFWCSLVPTAPKEKIELFNAFIISGCTGIVSTWLNGGMKDSPEIISRLVFNVVTSSVEKCIG
ncbi:MAG: TetR/AcrR family transcriptional regulator [Eubacteriales bacterium]|nr:TetR/AcrR family transcriptional regulator [Eubacteriales bacterium]